MSASSALVGVVNAGSSSLKISYYEDERRVLSCQVDGIGVRPAMKATNAADEAVAGLDFTHTQPRTPSAVRSWGMAKVCATAGMEWWKAVSKQATCGSEGALSSAVRIGARLYG